MRLTDRRSITLLAIVVALFIAIGLGMIVLAGRGPFSDPAPAPPESG